VALAVAALVNFVQSTSEPESAKPPPAAEQTETQPTDTGGALPGVLPEIIPLPGELRQAGGLLWWAGGECEARVLELSSGAVTGVSGRRCRIWPQPHGASAAVPVSEGEAGADPSLAGLAILDYPAPEGERVLGGSAELRHSPGFVASEVVWAPRGERVAVCVVGDEGPVVDVLRADGARSSSIENACFPAFLADGRLAVVRGSASIELGGQPLVGEATAEALLPSVSEQARRLVTSLGSGRGRVVAGYAAIDPSQGVPTSAAVAVLEPDGTIEFSAHLRPDALPAATGLAPDGSAVWYYDATSGVAVVLEIPGGRRLQPFRARWLSWSPDGDYLAAATDDGIGVYTWPDERQVAEINTRADILTWTEQPQQEG
jgi:hypothetical protein